MIENELNEYVNIHNIITNEKYRKNILSNINLTSYNNKDIILKTWDDIKDNPIINQKKESTFEDEMDDFFINEDYTSSETYSDSSNENFNQKISSIYSKLTTIHGLKYDTINSYITCNNIKK